MNRIILLVLLILSSKMIHANTIIPLVEKQLDIDVPQELATFWNSPQFDTVNRLFNYYNYGEMIFLSESDVHDFTKNRIANGSMNESNSMYFKVKDGEYTEDDYKRHKLLFFRDPVMSSKFVSADFQQYGAKVKKCIVFAVSTWQEGFTYMFYGFDEQNKNMGIWIWKKENSKIPVFLGENIESVLGSTSNLILGFAPIEEQRQSINNYFETKPIDGSNLAFGVYPKFDLRELTKEVTNSLILFEDERISNQPKEILNEISNLYLNNGITLDFDSRPHEYLGTYLSEINSESFSPKNSKNFFKITYSFSYQLGLVYVSPKEAQILNQYSLIFFGGRDETDLAFKWLSY